MLYDGALFLQSHRINHSDLKKKASRVWRVSLFFVTLHSTKPTTLWQGGLHNLNGIPRLSIPSVRTVKGKGRFLNVTICKFKLRKLETKCRCNATGASARVYYTRTTCGISLSEMCAIVPVYYNTTRRGLACVAYPYLGAMRRPELEDRRGEFTPTPFFVSIPEPQ